MARLFISKKEINFINDTAKELIKDVIGQKIYYYSISEIKSKVHDVYEESSEKIFENPIEIECLVKYQEPEIRTNRFGSEKYFKIEAYIQSKDLLDKNIEILEGDFFSFGSVFFEITQAPSSNIIFGQIEYGRFITVKATQAREGQFKTKVFGPTSESYNDSDAIQETFVQQRGFENNRLGKTGDVRELQKNGILQKPINSPAEVSTKGTSKKKGSSFYGDE